MKVQGFNHITLTVSSLERSLSFYVDILGMQLVHRGAKDVYLEWGSAWVCLLERPDLGRAAEQQLGVDHAAFTIAEEHFDEAVQVLQDKGVTIVRGPINRGTGMAVNFLDPDGIQLELHTSTLADRMKVWS
ncbi:VOC family protein [Paenibacillus turpanensis]|uniref:VOC family protein n=1 Tax=Paenibacillus turpanensis TaxID=2689078 RepID=UPI00140A697A|nr:VOC family protein [Paenibacillus turpanensis]